MNIYVKKSYTYIYTYYNVFKEANAKRSEELVQVLMKNRKSKREKSSKCFYGAKVEKKGREIKWNQRSVFLQMPSIRWGIRTRPRSYSTWKDGLREGIYNAQWSKCLSFSRFFSFFFVSIRFLIITRILLKISVGYRKQQPISSSLLFAVIFLLFLQKSSANRNSKSYGMTLSNMHYHIEEVFQITPNVWIIYALILYIVHGWCGQ